MGQAAGWRDRQGTRWPRTCQGVERALLLVCEPECVCEAMARVAMDSVPQASLHVAYRAGADTGSLCQFLLGHPGTQAKLLQRLAQLVFKSHGYAPFPTLFILLVR
jgi:hypothetical protein